MRRGLWICLCGGILGMFCGCGEEPEPEVPSLPPEQYSTSDDSRSLYVTDPLAMLRRSVHSDELAESAAESADATARTQYALDFVTGKVRAQDPDKVLGWLKDAAESGNRDASKALNAYRLQYGNADERRETLPRIRELAQSGDVESQMLMARCCLLGDAGEPQNESQAAQWCRQAADQGDPTAQFCLGIYRQTGTFPISGSAQLATKLLQDQRSESAPAAQEETDVADRDTSVPDEPVPPDPKEAAQWFRLAADQDFAPAQVALGRMYLQGNGVEQNPPEGLQWLRRAAENGDLTAQFSVGQCYLNGIGTEPNTAQGAQWLRRAAENGHPGAMESLGMLYQSGTGVPADASQAVEWLRRAADLGRERAAFLLGMCYQEGTGVPANSEEAIRWFRTAAARGDHMANNMLKILEEPK